MENKALQKLILQVVEATEYPAFAAAGALRFRDNNVELAVEYIERFWLDLPEGEVRYPKYEATRLAARLTVQPRRIWVHSLDIPRPDSFKISAVAISGNPEEDHIEFVEVKKVKS